MKSVLVKLITGCFLFFVLAIAPPKNQVFAACGYYQTSCSSSTVYCRGAGNGQVLCCSTQAECNAQPTIACVKDGECKDSGQTCCSGKQESAKKCASQMKCVAIFGHEQSKPLSDQCNNAVSDTIKTQCLQCMDNTGNIWTAIGCIDPSAKGLISKFLPFGIGVAGGIAILLILFGALQMMMSSGNPEKLNAGKELVGAAITGLLFIIFSVFILRLVGVDILKIPGFK